MVDRLSPVSSTAAPAATRVDQSFSLAEPDVAWTAERQSAINEGFRRLREDRPDTEEGEQPVKDEDGSVDRLPHHPARAKNEGEAVNSDHLSGESERIGTGNLEDEAPFGAHVGYV